MKHLLSPCLVTTLAITSLFTQAMDAQAEDRYAKQKVVYHINYGGGQDDKRYRGAMRNIQNHINAVGAENMEIKVVLHGNGLGLLSQAKSNDRLQGQVLELKGKTWRSTSATTL